MSRRKSSSWPDLPPELLSQITTRLKTRPDILHFRGVCKDWRRSVSLTLLSNKNVLSLFLPHKLSIKKSSFIELDDYGREFKGDSLIIVATLIFKIKPTFNTPELPPLLVTVEEINPGKLRVRKPLSKSAVLEKEKPHLFPKVLDLGRFEVEEIGKSYSLQFDKTPTCLDEEFLYKEDHKVILTVDSECKMVSTINDYIAIVMYDYGVLTSIKLKDAAEKQLVFNNNKVKKFDDIVMFKETVYVIDRSGKLYLIDNSCSDRLKLVNVVETQLKPGTHKRGRLVESCGDLYLVRKGLVNKPGSQKKCQGIRVFKLNQESMSWDEMESIGDDRIIFVTPDCCFFARTSDFYGCKGNCVVFHAKNSFPTYVQPSSYDSDSDENYYAKYDVDGDPKYFCAEVFSFEGCDQFNNVEYRAAFSVVLRPPPEWISSDTCIAKDENVREKWRRSEKTQSRTRWS